MSKREKKSGGRDGPPPIPAWFLTYADTVTLLMTFFVMLMSFSTLDEENYEKVRGALVGHLGMVSQGNMSKDSLLLRRMLAASRMFTEGFENPPEHDPISNVAKEFDVRVRSASMANVLDYKATDRGFEIHVMAGALFEEGTAEFEEATPRALRLIASASRHLPHRLQVIGRPDAFFVRSVLAETPDELAMQRAAAVCRFFAERAGMSVDRLATAAEVSEAKQPFSDTKGRQITVVVQRPLNRRKVK